MLRKKSKIENNGTFTKTLYQLRHFPRTEKPSRRRWTGRNDNNPRNIRQFGDGNIVDREAIGFDLAKQKKYWQNTGKGGSFEKILLAFSADGQRVAIANGSDKVEIRDAANGKLVNSLDNKFAGKTRLGGLALSSDGGTIAVASKDSKVQLWNAKEGNTPRQFTARLAQDGPNATACLHFSPDDKNLLLGVDADLQIYDADTFREMHPWEGHRGWVDHLAFSPDGKRLLTGSAGTIQAGGEYFGPNGELYYIVSSGSRGGLPSSEQAAWDVASWKRLQLTNAHTPPWPNFGTTSVQQSVYVGKNGDERFGLFDMKSGQQLGRMLLPEKTYRPGSGWLLLPRGQALRALCQRQQGPGNRTYLRGAVG